MEIVYMPCISVHVYHNSILADGRLPGLDDHACLIRTRVSTEVPRTLLVSSSPPARKKNRVID
jgi:hypothetical protein